DVSGIVNAGMAAGLAHGFLPENDKRIIAATKVVGGGESTGEIQHRRSHPGGALCVLLHRTRTFVRDARKVPVWGRHARGAGGEVKVRPHPPRAPPRSAWLSRAPRSGGAQAARRAAAHTACRSASTSAILPLRSAKQTESI